MRRLFYIIMISILLASCSTSEELAMPIAEEITEEAAATEADDTKYASEEIKVYSSSNEEKYGLPKVSERKDPEAPAPVVEEKEAEPKVEAEPQLKGKDLVDELNRMNEQKSEAPVEAPSETPVVETEAPAPEMETTVVETKSEETVPVVEAPVEKEETPSPLIEEKKESEAEKPLPAPEKKEAAVQSPFDERMSDGVFSVFISLVIVIAIYTLSSVIRSKYGLPLPWHVSLVFSLLLTAVPMLTSFLLNGWQNYQLIYASLIFTYPVFRQKNRKH